MKALIAYVRSGEPDLTNRQMALLMLVYLTPGPHTVRGLARLLGVSKPVVTRALNTLGGLGYLRRERDQDDRRNMFVVRTSNGAEFLEGFKRNIRDGDTAAPPTGRSPARPPPSLIKVEGFALAGPSGLPDPGLPCLSQGSRRRCARRHGGRIPLCRAVSRRTRAKAQLFAERLAGARKSANLSPVSHS